MLSEGGRAPNRRIAARKAARPRGRGASRRTALLALAFLLCAAASTRVVRAQEEEADDAPFEVPDAYEDEDDAPDYAPAGPPEGAPGPEAAPGPVAAPAPAGAPAGAPEEEGGGAGLPDQDWVNGGVAVRFLSGGGAPAFQVGRADAPETNIRVALDGIAELNAQGNKVRARYERRGSSRSRPAREDAERKGRWSSSFSTARAFLPFSAQLCRSTTADPENQPPTSSPRRSPGARAWPTSRAATTIPTPSRPPRPPPSSASRPSSRSSST